MAPGTLTAQFAVLVSEYHLTLPEIYALTPRQIHEVYFHPRDEHGGVKMPAGTAPVRTRADGLAQLLALAPMLKVSPGDVERLKRELEATRGGTRPVT
ncbi:MAG TPA: hypothetical protein VGE74_10635 [Gemmata sp.]